MQAIGFFNVYLMGVKLREWGQRGFHVACMDRSVIQRAHTVSIVGALVVQGGVARGPPK